MLPNPMAESADVKINPHLEEKVSFFILSILSYFIAFFVANSALATEKLHNIKLKSRHYFFVVFLSLIIIYNIMVAKTSEMLLKTTI